MREKFLAILAIAVAVLGGYTLFSQTKSTGPKIADGMVYEEIAKVASAEVSRSMRSSEGASSIASESTSSIQGTPQKIGVSSEDNVAWGSDPFVRDWVLSTEVANLNLQAITIAATGASVLINDQILQVGDEIRGKRVVDIKEDQVTLEQGGRTFTLTLGE
ncbi:MAG: hypothetical protein ACUVUD_02685 [bacterium]